MTQSNTAVEFRDVSFQRSRRQILSHLNFSVAAGETLVLLGRSGCGKTTTLKLVNRLLEPSAGEVRVEGRPTTLWDRIALRRRIGYVIQEVGLFPHLSVAGNVGLVPRLEGWEAERKRRRIWNLLELVGLEPAQFTARYPGELSGGQQQRVGVARALALDPPLLLMDEPFGALDPLTRFELQREFRRLQERLRKTILFVTHDLYEALYLGHRIALMQEGRLLFAGSPRQLMHSGDSAVAAFTEPLRRQFEWEKAGCSPD